MSEPSALSSADTASDKGPCAFCHRRADLRVFDSRGNNVDVCEDHLSQAVDAVLTPPRVFVLVSGDRLPIEVVWHVGGAQSTRSEVPTERTGR